MISSKIQHKAPSSGLVKYWLARGWYGITGWEVVGKLPMHRKFVLIGAHHTSNWDFVFGLGAIFIVRLKASWMAKDSLFIWPLGSVMRALGGNAVDRSACHGVVQQTIDLLQESEQLVVMLSTEGTRKKAEFWKSGFYWIAHGAQVPIVCGYLDYEKKQACLGLTLMPSGSVKKDMDLIREFYRNVQAKKLAQVSPVCLQNESDIK